MRTPKQYLASAQDEGVFGAQPGFQSLALLLGKRTYEDWRFHEDHYSSSHTTYSEYALGWLEAGCRMVLVADPERRTVTVYRSRSDIRILTAEDTIDGADVVPGWSLPLAELFDQRD